MRSKTPFNPHYALTVTLSMEPFVDPFKGTLVQVLRPLNLALNTKANAEAFLEPLSGFRRRPGTS